jgi:CheY-like chemotaxis protein/anti-sigma regulatory factor (Ser/Thr protein kinase)
MAHQKHQQVNYAVSIDSVFLDVDARRIKQVLVNLLSNAIKFTPENGELGLMVEHDQPNRQVMLIVWDKGIGIKPENLPRLFQPFTQIDGSLAREYSGTGLGLALVRRLVELHNGSVAVESVFGEGSRFIVTLPWTPHTEHAGSPGAEDEQSLSASIHENRSAPIILITDDNQILLEMLTDFLQSQQYRTVKAHNGMELLEKIEGIRPDVIMMDIQMPGMDGLETIRRVRHHRDALIASTPIIAVTALVMPGDRELCLEAGANEYLSKPLNLKHLAAVIHDLAPGVAQTDVHSGR